MNIDEHSHSYPLTSLQEGLLFNSISASEPGVDIIQVICSLHEDLHIPFFEQAWQQVCSRHSSLRTTIHWEEESQPIQVVHEQIVLPFHVENWQSISSQEQQVQLEEYLLNDRLHGFGFAEEPLLRLALFRLAQAAYHCVLTFHHAILDGRSLPIILGEAFDLYEAFRSGTTLILSPTRPYHDYVTWLQTQDPMADEPFWRQFLDGFTASTPLPISSNLQADNTAGISHVEQSIALPISVSQSLRRVADQHQLTLHTLLQGAWAFVLSRYSGQKEVLFGSVLSCRHGSIDGAESMAGLFLNTLPLRVQVNSAASLLTWLRALRIQWSSMRAHQLTPLKYLQQWSQLPGGVPLFESIFLFESLTLQSTMRARGGLWLQRTFSLRRKPSYPLALYIFAEPEIQIVYLYDQRRFASATITRMLNHIQSVLITIANNPDTHLADLPLMTEAERQQVLVAWNATQQEYPQQACIHELIEEHAERMPDTLAIQFGEECLTYRQLNEQANRVAHLLRSLSVGPEGRVGILMKRSPQVIICQLGILKAGGGFVMFDPASPQDRLNFMLEDAQVQVLLTLQEHMANLSTFSSPIIALDAPVGILAIWKNDNLTNLATSSNLAYIIYTSGSTGHPKGVEVQHRSLVNLITWHCQIFAVGKQDRAAHLASPAFDASVWEIWAHLLAGASLHLPNEEIWIDSHGIIDWFTQHAITIAFLPTALGEAVIQEHSSPQSALRVLCVGGDRLLRWPLPDTSFRVYNLYGPTECTVIVTGGLLLAPATNGTPPPIGYPISNTQIYLLDTQLDPVPIGAVGELYIGGAGLARGYLKRPELIAERFIPHPFSQQPGARLYRSGDLVRYQHDGQLEYLGRIDRQVKIRGFRIELGEIEATLVQHPAVITAVVLAQEEQGQQQLVAYLVPMRLDVTDIRRFLRQKLPEYMVPAVIIPLAALPLTANGKVDLRALPAPAVNGDKRDTPYAAPRTSMERELATIWLQALGIKPENSQLLGIHDNFFDLGGHSLLAGQVILRISRVLKIRLPIRSIFDAPTISSLATYIEKLSAFV